MATEPIKAGSDNPFTQPMGQAKSVAEDFTRLFSELKLPAMPDMEVLQSAIKRNMDTLAALNRITSDGAQAVARRHMEIMQQTMSELSETLRSFATLTDTPQAQAAKQTELLKKAYEHAISHTREIGKLIQLSNTEAVELLKHRFTEAIDEVESVTGRADHGTS